MDQAKDMLKKMGFKIVADEMETVEWADNDGFFVAERDKVFFTVLTILLTVMVVNHQLFP